MTAVAPGPRLEVPPAGSDASDAPAAPAQPVAPAKRRVLSLDAVRGFAIVIMLVALHPGPRGGLPYQLTHAKWHWVTFVDTFFPLFLFAVGAAMPFSSRASEWRAVIRRVVLLVLIGMVLVAAKHGAFPRGGGGVLQHIAISYLGARLILAAPRRAQLPIVGLLLAAISVVWVVAPSGDPWGRDTSLAHLVDGWLYGGFTVEGTVQSIVSIVNVFGGVVAGRMVRERADRDGDGIVPVALVWAVGLCVAALALHVAGMPMNKKLWTPSFGLFSTASGFFYFAVAYWAFDQRRWERVAQPLVWLGRNAITIYIVSSLGVALLDRVLHLPAHLLGSGLLASTVYATTWTALGVWFCRELDRRRWYLKV